MNTEIQSPNSLPHEQAPPRTWAVLLRNAGAAIAAILVAALAVELVGVGAEVIGNFIEERTRLVLVSTEFVVLGAAFWGAVVGVPTALVGTFARRWWLGPAVGLAVAFLLAAWFHASRPGLHHPAHYSTVAIFLVVVVAASVLGSLAGRWIRKPLLVHSTNPCA